MKRDSGQITAFVIVMTIALILVVGLVLDGGLILSARVKAVDEAQEAARAGAQAIDLQAYRERGVLLLDPTRAITAARAYLAAAGGTGEVRVQGQQVVVTVQRTQPTQLLHLIGVGSMTVHGVGSAHPVRGVTTVIP